MTKVIFKRGNVNSQDIAGIHVLLNQAIISPGIQNILLFCPCLMVITPSDNCSLHINPR